MSDKASETKELVTWTCEFPTVKKETSWTVGQKHILSCRGDLIEKLQEPVSIDIKSPPKKTQDGQEIPEDPNKNYALKVLGVKNIDNKSIDLVVTSYKPGQYKDVSFSIIGKEGQAIEVEPTSWEVTSSMTKENSNGFGPTSPLYLSLSWWYWGSIVGAIALMGLIVLTRLVLHLRWKGMLREMKSHATPLGATNQFYKDVRTLQGLYVPVKGESISSEKVVEYWRELEKAFHLYLVRQFQAPALHWSSARVLKLVSKKLNHVHSKRANSSLKTVFSEFKKGSTVSQGLQIKDIQQMEKLCQSYIELVKKIDQRGEK